MKWEKGAWQRREVIWLAVRSSDGGGPLACIATTGLAAGCRLLPLRRLPPRRGCAAFT